MAADQELLKAVKGILNILTTGQTKNLSSQTTNNATSQNTVARSSFDDYKENQIKENLRLYEEIERETAEIKKNIFSYETTYKRLNRLQADFKKIKDEIDKGGLTDLQLTQKKLQLAHKLNDIEKARAKLQIDGYTKLDDFNERLEKRTNAFKKGVGDIKKGFDDIVKSVKGFTDSWGKLSQASADYAKNVGMSFKGMENLRKSTLRTYNSAKLGINFNVSMDEILKLRQQYANGVGRNVTVSSEGLKNLAATSKLLGNEGATELMSKLENFGLSMEEAGNRAGKIWANASKFGISADKLSKNFLSNIKKAQEYTFANGLRGLEAMAKRATELKLDMGQAFAFADKVSNVEGAISTAASLQVLGGPFTQYSDALQMLQEGLTDPAKLQERMIKMFGSFGILNKQTGEVEVSAFNRQRIKAAAQAAGIDYSNAMEMVYANTRGNAIAEQAKSNGLFRDNESYLNLIRNVGTFKNGSAGAYLERNGVMQFVRASEMTKDDIKQLVDLNKSDSDNVQDIAKLLRGWDDVISGSKKQIEGAKAQVVENSRIGKGVMNLADLVTQNNAILNKIAIAAFISAGMGVVGGGWGMARGLARTGKGVGNLLSSSAGRTAIAGTTAAAETAAAGGIGSGAAGAATGSLVSKGGRVVGAASGRSFNQLKLLAGLKHPKYLLHMVKPALKAGAASGIMSGLFTGMEEFLGVNNHSTTRKIARTAGSTVGAIIGGTLGTAIAGPGFGTMVGAALGGELGKLVGGNDYRRNKKRAEWGLEHLNGDYSVRDLRRIKEGRISGKLQKTMEKNGDYTEISAYERQQLKASGDLNDMVKDMHDAMLGEGMAKVNGRANGGSIYGPGGVDNVPIWASRGEFIMSNKAVNMWGVDRLSAMNNYANTHNSMYANGGIIKPWRGYNAGSSNGSSTFSFGGGHSGTRGSDRLRIEPVKVDISGTIKLDLGGQTTDISADKLLKNGRFVRELSHKIETEIRRHWNAGANPVVRGADNI